jgi:hypothetical protein
MSDKCPKSTHGRHYAAAVNGPQADQRYFVCTYCGIGAVLSDTLLHELLAYRWGQTVWERNPVARALKEILG